MEFLTEVFVREDSLVPVKKLLGRVIKKVPRQLLLMYSEVVQMIDKGVVLRVLVEKLLEKVMGDKVCAARVIILAGRMAGVRKNKQVTVCGEGPDQDIG